MRVVVTGAAGRIGRHVVAELLERGHEVHALDRLDPPPDVSGSGSVWSRGEARDPAFMSTLMSTARADALVHLAALPTPHHGTPLEVFATNVEATFTAMEAAGDAGVSRVVYASSISLTGIPFGQPGLAPLYAPLDEAHPNIGTDPYALSKAVDEATAAMMQRRHGYQVVGFRLPETNTMAAHLTVMAETAEDPRRAAPLLFAYLDVRDAARAFAMAIERDLPGDHVINVMAPDTYSALPSSELMARCFPSTPLRRPLVGRETIFDLTRSRELLGFEAEHLLPLPR